MSFGGGFDSDGEVMSEINMTPLVDVMLVLLIIFMLTVPVLTHSVAIDLPEAESGPTPTEPETVTVAIKADGSLYWGEESVNREVMQQRLERLASRGEDGALQLQADRAVRYEHVARLMVMAQLAGVERLGFVTLPVD